MMMTTGCRLWLILTATSLPSLPCSHAPLVLFPSSPLLFPAPSPSQRPGQWTDTFLTSRQTRHRLHRAVLHTPSLSTSARLSSANMTAWADDDKCRGGKAITESARCSRESAGGTHYQQTVEFLMLHEKHACAPPRWTRWQLTVALKVILLIYGDIFIHPGGLDPLIAVDFTQQHTKVRKRAGRTAVSVSCHLQTYHS